jgi:sRNA-binding protein
MRTFARWQWASLAKSRRQWAGRFPIRSACSPGGKWRRVYCYAVLSYDQRIGLDGSPAEMVDAEAKELATKQMAQLEARRAAKKAAETARAAVVKRKPAQTRPTETPEQLRDRVRAGLLRRRA